MVDIGLYFASDDSLVSEVPLLDNAIKFPLRLDLEQQDEVRLYFLAEPGVLVKGVSISPEGSTQTKWALALDDGGDPGEYEDWGDALSVGDVDAVDKVYMWAKARATSDEDLANDVSVVLVVNGEAHKQE